MVEEGSEFPTNPIGHLILGYTLIDPIGAGAFGIVWEALIQEGKHKDEHVAVKILNMEEFPEISLNEIKVKLIRKKFLL